MAKQPIRILLIEDNPGDARLIELYLRETGGASVDFAHATTLDESWQTLDQDHADVVLLDLLLPDSIGIETVRRVHGRAPSVPIVVLTGEEDESQGPTAIQEGAEDFLVKGRLDGPVLIHSIRYAIERNGRRRAEEALGAAQQEMAIASRIQRGLYPEVAPAVPGYDIAAASWTATVVGGDYFDFFPMIGDWMGIAIGDCTGHGIGPALLMAETRACLRALAMVHGDVTEILAGANRVLTRGLPEKYFITLLLAQFSPREGAFVYTSAGHAPGFIFDPAGRVKATLKSTGVPLGITTDTDLTGVEESTTIEPGELVILLTNGIRQARSEANALFGDDRTFQVIHDHYQESARIILASLQKAVREHCHPRQPTDDFTAIIIKSV